MIDPKDYERAIQSFRQNPFWRGYYDDAPTERLKEWIGYQFCFSSGVKPKDDVISNLKRLENELNYQEWEYLHKYAGNNPFKARCRRMMEELKNME